MGFWEKMIPCAVMRQKETLRCEEMVGTLGIVIKDINNPIYDNAHNVVGCISIGISLDLEKGCKSCSKYK